MTAVFPIAGAAPLDGSNRSRTPVPGRGPVRGERGTNIAAQRATRRRDRATGRAAVSPARPVAHPIAGLSADNQSAALPATAGAPFLPGAPAIFLFHRSISCSRSNRSTRGTRSNGYQIHGHRNE